MKEVLMYNPAINLVKVLAQVKKNETVLILTDFKTESLTRVIASVVTGLEAIPLTMAMPITSGHGGELPHAVRAAMCEVDVIIAPTTYNIAHTNARYLAQKKGVRIIVLPEAHDDILLSSGLEADFKSLKPRVEKLAKKLTKGKEIRVTTKKGTDFTASIKGRYGRALTGFANSNDISAAHCIEASLAPVEGTGNGKLVIDGSISGIGVIDTLVTVEVVDGKAVSIEGGKEAVEFKELLESKNDAEGNIYNIAEFGIGMNPECHLENSMLSDEGVFGTVHLALGTNKYIGGEIIAKGHYDMVFKDATIEIDKEIVMENSELFLEEGEEV